MKLDDHPQYKKEEVEVDEAMRPGPRREKMRAKMHDPYVRGGSKSRGQAHNIAVRGDVSTGDPAIKSRGGGGVKKDKGMGYGDQGAGNKARRRMGQEPLRGNTRKEGFSNWRTDLSCLLYTSPSPRDATLSRMPSSA